MGDAEEAHAGPGPGPGTQAGPAAQAEQAEQSAPVTPHAEQTAHTGQSEQEAHAELEQLRRAMETRPVIDQAHGVLMAAYRCTPDHAWSVLVTVSQRTNTKLHTVAAALVESTQGHPLPEPLASALRSALNNALNNAPDSANNANNANETGQST